MTSWTIPGTARWYGFDASRAWKKTSGFWAVPRTTGASGRQAAGPEREDIFLADERPDIGLIEHGDLVDLVRGPEAVEEVEERDPRPERRGMRDQREVVRFLDRARREHRPAGRAGVHDVAVVAEDREGMRRDRPGRDMDDRRRQLAGDLEHVGDHQEQALRRREASWPARPSGAPRGGLRPHPPRTASRRRRGPCPTDWAGPRRTSRRSARPSGRRG